MDDPLRASGRLANSELRCKNSCGFYGNPMWDGYCSKCYKELKDHSPLTKRHFGGEEFGDESPSATQPASAGRSSSLATSPDLQSVSSTSSAAAASAAPGPAAPSTPSQRTERKLSAAIGSKRSPSSSPSMRQKLAGAMSSPQAAHRSASSVKEKSSLVGHGKAGASARASSASGINTEGSITSSLPTLGFGKFEEKKRTHLHRSRLGIFKKGPEKDAPDSTAVSGESGPHDAERVKAAADLTELLKTMKRAVSQDVTKHTKAFVRRIVQNSKLNSEEHSELVQEFYQWIEGRMQTQTMYRGVSADQQKQIMDHIEMYLMACAYTVVWSCRDARDEEKDKTLSLRLRHLQWVSPSHLEISSVMASTKALTCLQRAQHELLMMDGRHTPSEKLRNVTQCCKHIFNALTHSSGGQPASADDFLPVLIYVVLQAAPPRMNSNIQYISRFSYQNNLLSGESGYHFTNLCCAVAFLENATANQLHVSDDEFDGMMSQLKKKMPDPDGVDQEDSVAARAQSPALKSLHHSLQRLIELRQRQDKQIEEFQQLKKEFTLFRSNLVARVEEILKSPAPTQDPEASATVAVQPPQEPIGPNTT